VLRLKQMSRPTLVSISGFSSEVGKTTLLCKLLGHYPGWEAIKVTRGHYRSCGKDPHACCVSHLLGEKPLVLSGRQLTYKPGKDTGRYWESGASNVHWVIGTDEQIEEGVTIALSRVEREGVFIEGNSFLKHIGADYSIMVANPSIRDIKSSAVRVMPKMNALLIYTSNLASYLIRELQNRMARRGVNLAGVPIYSIDDLPLLAKDIMRAHKLARAHLSKSDG
jgi:hypothetical protein